MAYDLSQNLDDIMYLSMAADQIMYRAIVLSEDCVPPGDKRVLDPDLLPAHICTYSLNEMPPKMSLSPGMATKKADADASAAASTGGSTIPMSSLGPSPGATTETTITATPPAPATTSDKVPAAASPSEPTKAPKGATKRQYGLVESRLGRMRGTPTAVRIVTAWPTPARDEPKTTTSVLPSSSAIFS